MQVIRHGLKGMQSYGTAHIRDHGAKVTNSNFSKRQDFRAIVSDPGKYISSPCDAFDGNVVPRRTREIVP